ncbi:hypothetical protein AciX9_4071 (plasmid) [Granulicella tundricola MP5ACTX9]|uniref:Uncharacterized protein n=1 Tax=Granulicella tundricola (strain ATCC BAA-1859 / DSM 23138 / MP5ACTX9) TaxID=1198114 RepID=E8X5X1_GRATM|nr:hypothetical protein AciX9_4071 [Granulicella tundricola MP5ACTX9]
MRKPCLKQAYRKSTRSAESQSSATNFFRIFRERSLEALA